MARTGRADAGRAWPEGTWRRRVAAVVLPLHGDPRRKRESPLKSARWGQAGGGSSVRSFDSFLRAWISFVLNTEKKNNPGWKRNS